MDMHGTGTPTVMWQPTHIYSIRARLEWRKNVGKTEVSIPEERKSSNTFGTKESKVNFPEERRERLSVWRKGNICFDLMDFFPVTLTRTHALIKLLPRAFFFLVSLSHSFTTSGGKLQQQGENKEKNEIELQLYQMYESFEKF
jgi:hypothetical protein